MNNLILEFKFSINMIIRDILYYMKFKIVTVFFILFNLSCSIACQPKYAQPQFGYYISDNVAATLLPTGGFASNVVLTQNFAARYDGNTYNLTSIIKLSSTEMQVIGMTDLGRLFTINYDKQGVITSETSNLFIPSVFRSEYVLADIQLIYFPVEALESSLPTDVRLQEIMDEGVYGRSFFVGEREIISIKYDNPDIFVANVDFVNIERNYSYYLTLLDNE